MREIEVKARLQNKELFLQKAAEKGITFGDPIVQEDTTYETEIPKDDPRWNIFRIRKQGDKLILTMKYKASSRSRDNHERETTIADADQVAGMLERVGYTYGIQIRKSRQIAHYNDLELCLDEIDKLGSFVEVEKLTSEEADVDAIQAELWNLLLELGVSSEDRTHKGYDILMHELVNS
jgi:adenylate cyclase, class 2